MKHFPKEPRAKQSLRLWLKLLSVSGQVENIVRGNLRNEFDTTLPRFDVMAMLDFAGNDGLSMGDLSRKLMVSNGNVTGIVNRLEAEGLISRKADERDRRTQWVKLTDEGKRVFKGQAKEHESWLETLMKDVSKSDMDQLTILLDTVRTSVETNKGEVQP
ncbi:MAG: MarR family transcriptional regulator [Sphingomonadales bacterium]|nr:MarR family transcriptional regulator [Sphingomonadales bacterium]